MGFGSGVFASGHFYRSEDEAKTGKAFFLPFPVSPPSPPLFSSAVLFTELHGDFIT